MSMWQQLQGTGINLRVLVRNGIGGFMSSTDKSTSGHTGQLGIVFVPVWSHLMQLPMQTTCPHFVWMGLPKIHLQTGQIISSIQTPFVVLLHTEGSMLLPASDDGAMALRWHTNCEGDTRSSWHWGGLYFLGLPPLDSILAWLQVLYQLSLCL